MTANSGMLLGRQVDLPASPREAVLQAVPAPDDNTANLAIGAIVIGQAHNVYQPRYIARFSCPEFTSLCPVTALNELNVVPTMHESPVPSGERPEEGDDC